MRFNKRIFHIFIKLDQEIDYFFPPIFGILRFDTASAEQRQSFVKISSPARLSYDLSTIKKLQ
jgi:hypothetical protein